MIEIVVITGGRDRTPTMAELERLDLLLFGEAGVETYRRLRDAGDDTGIGAAVLREGDCRGTDKAVGAYLRARKRLTVESWPARWRLADGTTDRAAGAKRNHAMLAGAHPDGPRPRATRLISFDGGAGTQNCREAAYGLGLPVLRIHAVAEPRPWNRHHGEPRMYGSTAKDAPVAPTLYCGRGSPVGNPWPLDVPAGQTRAQAAPAALERYRAWLMSKILPRSPDYDRRIVAFIESLTPDHFVVCSCWPAHCHVEIVIRAWRWLTRPDR